MYTTRNFFVSVFVPVTPKSDRFRYLGSILQKNGELDGDLNHRIQAGWLSLVTEDGLAQDIPATILSKRMYKKENAAEVQLLVQWSVDTLNHKLDPSTGKLYTTRAITVHAPGPWFVRKIVRQDVCHCVESTVVDAQARSMQLATNNISLEKFIEVEEKIRYDPHPENPNGWTLCRQETSIRIKPLSALASMAEKVEQRCAEKFVQNSAKGREVMEKICKYLEAESKGISF
ncbi:hypothetical protein DVH24_041946 [Malus domestica]|uniref:PRELI/MSF1 domain-containing protein n=1 Tax=Malus domestica TaxID=3750 RepID=A0A498INR5_MALDO|nr:hypothetical protein DVH24_041946 [Malus domestica]